MAVNYVDSGDWDLCYASLKNFTQSGEAMVECKQVGPQA